MLGCARGARAGSSPRRARGTSGESSSSTRAEDCSVAATRSGATGVAQAVEVTQQFATGCPPREQVPDPEWALVHNLSGSANVHSIMIYQGGAA